MFKSYLLIAFRTIYANKLFSAINILGLALGLAVCFLILIFVRYESSYDRHYENAERTYRITRHYNNDDIHVAGIAAPFKPIIKAQFDEVEAITLLGMSFDLPLSRGETYLNVTDMLMADNDIFDVFDLEVIHGDKSKALIRKNTLVLTESIAHTFFGDVNPVGKFLFLNARKENGIEVTAVIKDQPANSHMQFSLLMSIDTMRDWLPHDLVNLDSNYYYIYLRLKEGVNPEVLIPKFSTMMQQLGVRVTDDQSLALQPVRDIHLQSNLSYEITQNGSYTIVYSFSAIAMIILLIACINFMNLSTSRFNQRSKEVGVRKVLGASKTQLAWQFLIESVLMTVFAMFIACALVELCLPTFAQFIKRDLVIDVIYHWQALFTIIFITVGVGFFAGCYPAFYIAHFNPSRVFKRSAGPGNKTIYISKALVVLQFSISIALIIGTLVVLKQTDYARKTDSGYNHQNKVILPLSHARGYKSRNKLYDFFRAKLLQHPDIVSITASQQLLTEPLRDIWSYVRDEQTLIAENMVNLPTVNIGFDFFEHYQIPLLSGRYFSKQSQDAYVKVPTRNVPVGTGNAVLSRSAAKALGYQPDDAVGQYIKIPFPPGYTKYLVVGVVEDVHIGSLRHEQQPQIYHLVKDEERYISIEFNPENEKIALAYIDKIFTQLMPDIPNERSFFGDSFSGMYLEEDKQAQVFTFFSTLAIVVASMGLFGLTAFTTERRRKEIGIRQVMGASIVDIVWLLTREFSVLVLVANILAWPIAYFAMNAWLENFSQAISLDIWLFVAAGIFPLILTWIIIISQASYRAIIKPINNLRTE